MLTWPFQTAPSTSFSYLLSCRKTGSPACLEGESGKIHRTTVRGRVGENTTQVEGTGNVQIKYTCGPVHLKGQMCTENLHSPGMHKNVSMHSRWKGANLGIFLLPQRHHLKFPENWFWRFKGCFRIPCRMWWWWWCRRGGKMKLGPFPLLAW